MADPDIIALEARIDALQDIILGIQADMGDMPDQEPLAAVDWGLDEDALFLNGESVPPILRGLVSTGETINTVDVSEISWWTTDDKDPFSDSQQGIADKDNTWIVITQTVNSEGEVTGVNILAQAEAPDETTRSTSVVLAELTYDANDQLTNINQRHLGDLQGLGGSTVENWYNSVLGGDLAQVTNVIDIPELTDNMVWQVWHKFEGGVLIVENRMVCQGL